MSLKINPNPELLNEIKDKRRELYNRIKIIRNKIKQLNLCVGLYYKFYEGDWCSYTWWEKCIYLNLDDFRCNLDINKKKCFKRNWFTRRFINCSYRVMEKSQEYQLLRNEYHEELYQCKKDIRIMIKGKCGMSYFG